MFRQLSRDVRLWLTLVAVVVGATALAAALVVQGEHATARERAANRLHAHTLEVLAEVGSFTTVLSDIQGGARGYLLTDDPQYLSRQANRAQAVRERLHRLQALTADNPGQQRRLAALAVDAEMVLSLSERIATLESAGRRAAALDLVRGGAQRAAMERARATSAAVVVEERRLLALRRAAALQATSRSARLTVVLAFLGAGLLVVAAGLGSVAFLAAARARLAGVRAAAHEQQAALAALLSLFIAEAPAAIAMFDRQMRYLAVSRRYVADYGLPADADLVGRSHYEVFPEIPQRWREIHDRVLAGERESCEEDAFPRADGRVDWVRWRMVPWRDGLGEVNGALLFSEVVSAQVESRRAHLTAEARLRAIVETAIDAIVVIDEAGLIQSVNPATETLFGYAAGELVGRNVSMLMPNPHRSAHDGYLAAYRKTGRRNIIGVGREVAGLRKDGATVPIDLSVAEWTVEGQRHFTGLMRDASVRKAAEAQRLQAERRELVVSELRHRIGNMLSVLSGLVAATARSHRDVESYRDALLDRIAAFGATQAVLARQAWSSLGLRQLVDFELKPYAEEGRRLSIRGEELNLTGSAAESLAMVVHELATNAAKYGALGAQGGALDVDWRLVREGSDHEPRLLFQWTERGGPPVTPPQRRGFGSTVIQNSARALGGTARIDYAPEGLSCAIDVPAARALQPAEGPGAPAPSPDALTF